MQALAAIRKPIVWTLHDMWAMTGGCHYAGDCTAFMRRCGTCPQLLRASANDHSARLFAQKRKHWARARFQAVTPSRWLAEMAQQSALLAEQPAPVVIPNAIDTQQFKPLDKQHSRRALNLPEKSKIVLFGAVTSSNPYKGYGYLQATLQKLAQTRQDVAFVSFGGGTPPTEKLGVPVYHLGTLHDEVSLTLAYSAADVFVFPSTQETFGLVAAEAMACETPVVAFRTTAIPEMVLHQQNGYLAEPFNTDALARGIDWVLEQGDALRAAARAHVLTNYTYAYVAARHLALYEALLAR